MVNTGASTSLKSELPEVQISLNTFTNLDPYTYGTSPTGSRFCSFEITIIGVKLPLAYAAFGRVFAYIQNLANNDINPISGVNNSPIPNTVGAIGTTPKSICNIQVDRSEIIPIVSLLLNSENLRLDYMDEFFNRTLEYLQNTINQDLNPDV